MGVSDHVQTGRISVTDSTSHIIDAETLRKQSGKRSPSAVRKWASKQGIRTLEGADGPWTTLEAVNKALGVGSANDPVYRPDDIA